MRRARFLFLVDGSLKHAKRIRRFLCVSLFQLITFLAAGCRAGDSTVFDDLWMYDNDGAHGHANNWQEVSHASTPAWPGNRLMPL
eukprot:SAG31_NODE_36099_length_316_cov_1.147465_1_plen_84_part_01